jgi:hypothetical protein
MRAPGKAIAKFPGLVTNGGKFISTGAQFNKFLTKWKISRGTGINAAARAR